MICAGIDSGSRSVKVVLIDADTLSVLHACQADQGIDQSDIAARLLDSALAAISRPASEIARTVATGYGRTNIRSADSCVTEITCHALGVRHVMPSARTVIDIGGQDSKLIRLATDGTIEDFFMNDRCAAGTGCFLEILAEKLSCPLDGLGALAAAAKKPAVISSMCVVFAQTEIIGLLAQRIPPADIVAGVQQSIASRIAAMAGRNLPAPVVFTGGVALVPGMDSALSAIFAQPVALAPTPQYTGALGAALLAARNSKPVTSPAGACHSGEGRNPSCQLPYPV